MKLSELITALTKLHEEDLATHGHDRSVWVTDPESGNERPIVAKLTDRHLMFRSDGHTYQRVDNDNLDVLIRDKD